MTKKGFVLIIVVLLAIGFALRACFQKPSINFMHKSVTVGTKPLEIKFSGVGKGLKNIRISYSVEGKTLLLESKNYPEGIKEDTVKVSLSPFAGIEDGPAQIKAMATSYRGLRSLKFSETSVKKTKDIVADLSPPKITVISSTDNISHSGSGIAVYKVSNDAVESGIRVGDRFFRGYKAAFNGEQSSENIYISFFSYPYDLPEGETILIMAKDEIGNRKNLPIDYSIKEKNFQKQNIEISERFIKMKISPLVSTPEKISLKEAFLLVNNKIRAVNKTKIAKILSRTANKIIWEGPFIRPVGALQSGFEERDYLFKGKLIDKQFHLGYDIASRKKNPVRASNNGIVIFADDLGIYGNTLILDHGMGVATLYSHLSSMTVQRGDTVSKGDTIGNTGATGLALGDHLHFGIYVGGNPVLPIEWWDPFWVKTRITQNIEEAIRRKE